MLVAAAIAVAVGVAVGNGRAPFASPLTVAAVIAAAMVAAMWRRGGRALVVAAFAVVVCASGASAAWRDVGTTHAILPKLATSSATVEACGETRGVGPRSVAVAVDRVRRGQVAWSAREPLVMTGHGVEHAPVGQRLCARGTLKAGTQGPLLVVGKITRRAPGSEIRIAAASVRAAYARAASRALPRTEAGLLLGMTDGDTQLLPDAVVLDFRTTGLAHLVAVSGENVAVLLAMVVVLSRLLVRRGRWLRAAVAFPPLVFFAFLSGLQPSVMRAVITAGIGLAVSAEGRASDALKLTCASFVVLVLATPEVLSSVGFQLSFAATFGLIAWSGPIAERITGVVGDGRLSRILVLAASTTIAAQAAVAPLLAWRFGRIPALGGIANLVCVPIAGFITVGGLVTLSIASVVTVLGPLPAALRLPLDLILLCAKAFARLPFASVGASVLIGACVVAALAAFAASSSRVRASALAFGIVCASAAAGQGIAHSHCDGPSVTALDIGQGSAVLLSDSGHAILVDAGPAHGEVVAQIEAAGVHRLDAIVITHPHIDHALGALDIFKQMRVGALYGPPALHWTSGATVIAAAKAARIPFDEVVAGGSISAGSLTMDALWPPPGDLPPYASDLVDANSLVLRARVGDVEVVLPGDIRALQQRAVARDVSQAPILVAPHHGSKDLDPGFVDAVDARIVLVTVGRGNPYGLPAPEAIAQYASRARVLRTDDDGRVTVCLTTGTAEVTTTR